MHTERNQFQGSALPRYVLPYNWGRWRYIRISCEDFDLTWRTRGQSNPPQLNGASSYRRLFSGRGAMICCPRRAGLLRQNMHFPMILRAAASPLTIQYFIRIPVRTWSAPLCPSTSWKWRKIRSLHNTLFPKESFSEVITYGSVSQAGGGGREEKASCGGIRTGPRRPSLHLPAWARHGNSNFCGRSLQPLQAQQTSPLAASSMTATAAARHSPRSSSSWKSAPDKYPLGDRASYR